MVFLKKFYLLSERDEFDILAFVDNRRIYNTQYPLKLFPLKELKEVDFGDITIFYGGNGSGKSTLLNIIGRKIGANFLSNNSKGSYFDLYVKKCSCDIDAHVFEKKVVTSDDVFDYLLNIRTINSNVSRVKEKLGEEYLSYKFSEDASSFDNYEEVKRNYEAKNKSMSEFIRNRLTNNNISEQSNGESALMFWEREIKENGIYILDEPENSLSASNILKLKQFIEESVRFYNSQFIISTHSPFLLALFGAKIYDLDSSPVKVKNWTLLDNVRVYYDFFKERESEF